jgi:hypothetical protein
MDQFSGTTKTAVRQGGEHSNEPLPKTEVPAAGDTTERKMSNSRDARFTPSDLERLLRKARGFTILLMASLELLGGHWIFAQDTNEDDFCSINTDQIQFFRNAVDQAKGPVIVLAFGDSMSDSYRSIQVSLFARLQERLGVGGYSMQNVWNTMLWCMGGGTSEAGPTTNWWTGHWQLPASGFL